MLSIVIVNYYTLDLVRECIDTLRAYHNHLDMELHIVNNSPDDTHTLQFREDYPNILWHEMDYNAGFARANNKGIQESKGEYILLLNPDIIFIEPILEECMNRMRDNPNIAASGVQLLNADRSFQISGNYFYRGGTNHLLPIPYWGSLLRSLALSLKSSAPHLKQNDKREKVDWINGAFMMVRQTCIEESGKLDEDFFMYSEEIEWCSRIKDVGELEIFGDLKLIHLIGQSSKKSSDKEYFDVYSKKGLQIIVGCHLRIRKQYGILWLLFLYMNYVFGALLGLPMSVFASVFNFSFKPLKQSILFMKNIMILTSLLPRIVLNRPHFYKLM